MLLYYEGLVATDLICIGGLKSEVEDINFIYTL